MSKIIYSAFSAACLIVGLSALADTCYDDGAGYSCGNGTYCTIQGNEIVCNNGISCVSTGGGYSCNDGTYCSNMGSYLECNPDLFNN